MADEHPIEQLAGFLAKHYNAEQLRWFARLHLPGDIWTSLPEGTASRDMVANELVHTLDRQRMLDAQLFARLAHERSSQREHVDRIRRAFAIEDAVPADTEDGPLDSLRLDLYATLAPLEYGLASQALRLVAGQPPAMDEASQALARHLARLLDVPRMRRWQVWCELLAALKVPANPELVAALSEIDRVGANLPEVIATLRGLVGLVMKLRQPAPPAGWSHAHAPHVDGVFVGVTAEGPTYLGESSEEWTGDPAALLAALRTRFAPGAAKDPPGDGLDFRGRVEVLLLAGGELLPGGWIRYARCEREGSSARLYHGRHVGFAREVAIKIAREDLDLSVRQQFRREADLLARLDEPGIVSVLASGESRRGQPFIVQELIDGKRLDEQPAIAGDAARAERYLELLRQWARALTLAHSRSIVHRDIAPQNLMVRNSGDAVVVDFGLAREYEVGRTAQSLPHVTERFRPPEHHRGNPAGDAYALAASVLERASGEEFHPVGLARHDTAVQRQLAAIHAAGRAGRELAAWIDAFLNSSAERGPQLLVAAAGGKELPPGLGWFDRTLRSAQRHPALVTAGFVAVAAIVVLAQQIGHERTITRKELAFARQQSVEIRRRLRDNLENDGDRHVENQIYDLAALSFARALEYDDNPRLRGKLLRAAAEPALELLWQVSESGPRIIDDAFLVPDGTLVGRLNGDELSLWDTRSGALVRVWPIPGERRTSHRSALSPAGDRLAIRYTDFVFFIDLAGGLGAKRELHGTPTLVLPSPPESDFPIAWTGDGKQLLALTCLQAEDDNKYCTRIGLRAIDPEGQILSDAVDLVYPELFDSRHGGMAVRQMATNRDGSVVALATTSNDVLLVDGEGTSVGSHHLASAQRTLLPFLAVDGDDGFFAGIDGSRGILTLDGRQHPVSTPHVPALGALSRIRRMPDGDLLIAGCLDEGARCSLGILVRTTPDGSTRWISRIMGEPADVVLDKEQVVVLAEEPVAFLRVDASTGEHLGLATIITGASSSGKDRTIFPEANALVTRTRISGRVNVRVRDLDSGKLVAYADRAVKDLRWAELLPDGEMVAVDDGGQVFSLGEFAMGERKNLLSGAPLAPRHLHPILAASQRYIAGVDTDANLHLMTRDGGGRTTFPVSTTTKQVVLLDEPPRLLTADTAGIVREHQIPTGEVLREWSVPFEDVNYLDFGAAPHADWLAMVDTQSGVTLLDGRFGGNTRRTIETTGRASLHVSASQDATWVWSRAGGTTSSLSLYPDSPEATSPLLTLRLADSGHLARVTTDERHVRLFTGLGHVQGWRLSRPSIIPSRRIDGYDDHQRFMLWYTRGPTLVEAVNLSPVEQPARVASWTIPAPVRSVWAAVAPGGRHVLLNSDNTMYLWDPTTTAQPTPLAGGTAFNRHCGFDSTASWAVFAGRERTLYTLDLKDKALRANPSQLTFADEVTHVSGAGPGRFLIQEGPRILRTYSVATDALGPSVDLLANIRTILPLGEESFVVIHTDGNLREVSIKPNGAIVPHAGRGLQVQHQVEGVLQGPRILLTRGEPRASNVDGVQEKWWELWSIATGEQLAALGPWRDGILEIRGDELWMVEPLEGVPSLSRELRIPLELLEQTPDAIRAALESLRGGDSGYSPEERARNMSIEPVPAMYVID